MTNTVIPALIQAFIQFWNFLDDWEVLSGNLTGGYTISMLDVIVGIACFNIILFTIFGFSEEMIMNNV